MKKQFRILIGLTLISLLSGCTHILYHGELDVLNSEGKARQSVLYWSKSESWFGHAKAGPIVLMTACSTRRINFEDTETGIVFRGMPGADRKSGHYGTVEDGMVCGKIETKVRITDLHAGPLSLSIDCEAVVDEFSIREDLFSPAYIQARNAPYQYTIREQNSWSWLGQTPKAPEPPECK